MATTTKRVITNVMLVGVALLLYATPASAVGETIGTCIFENVSRAETEYGSVHALEDPANKDALASFEADLELCVEAPNPILPELDEIIWGGAAFAILFAFMWWKGFPAVSRAMKARSDKIAADLKEAEVAKQQANEVLADHQGQLAGAKDEASQIVDAARVQAEEVANEIKARANQEAEQIRAKAAADVEAARMQAVSDLRGTVADIAVGAAQRVIKTNLDVDTQRALIDDYIDEVTYSNA